MRGQAARREPLEVRCGGSRVRTGEVIARRTICEAQRRQPATASIREGSLPARAAPGGRQACSSTTFVPTICLLPTQSFNQALTVDVLHERTFSLIMAASCSGLVTRKST